MCCTDTGVLGIKDINPFHVEFGQGIDLYFKLLKSLGALFLFFFIISLPISAIYAGSVQNNTFKNYEPNVILTRVSLGNIGESVSDSCVDGPFLNSTLTLSCDYGNLVSLEKFSVREGGCKMKNFIAEKCNMGR